MVQLGNIHVGRAGSAKSAEVSIAEAARLWELLTARYLCLEETGIYLNYAHDPEFKTVIKQGMDLLSRQTLQLEEQARLHKVAMPLRPAEAVDISTDKMLFKDEFLFHRIFTGCQEMMRYLVDSFAIFVTTDPLREMARQFLTDEMTTYDRLVKYGKQKAWLESPPMYAPG